MTNNVFSNRKYFHLFASLILLTIMFVLTETGINLNIYGFLTPYKITLLLAAIMFLGVFLKKPKLTLDYTFRSIKSQLKEVKILVILIASYIVFDLISFFHTTNKSVALVKYVTIISMLAIVFLYILYLNNSKETDNMNTLLVFLSVPSVTVIVYTWVYLFINKTTYYSRRLSLIQDYNKFSILLLFSFIALVFLIFRTVENLNKRNLFFAISLIICTSTIHLTASRRTARMMNILLILFYLYSIYDIYQKTSTKKNTSNKKNDFAKAITKFLVSIFIASLLSSFIVFTYNYLTSERVEKATQSEDGVGFDINRGSEEVLQDEEALNKRTTIWKMALNSYLEYPVINKIIGGGSSAHLDVYNEPENMKILSSEVYWKDLPDNTVDPHNFLLVDLLNGGIVLVLITLSCMVTILVLLFKLFKKSIIDTFFILIFSITILGDIAISSRNGIFDNKFIWLILILLITAFNTARNKKDDEENK